MGCNCGTDSNCGNVFIEEISVLYGIIRTLIHFNVVNKNLISELLNELKKDSNKIDITNRILENVNR